jgi:hypothetical protein
MIRFTKAVPLPSVSRETKTCPLEISGMITRADTTLRRRTILDNAIEKHVLTLSK